MNNSIHTNPENILTSKKGLLKSMGLTSAILLSTFGTMKAQNNDGPRINTESTISIDSIDTKNSDDEETKQLSKADLLELQNYNKVKSALEELLTNTLDSSTNTLVITKDIYLNKFANTLNSVLRSGSDILMRTDDMFKVVEYISDNYKELFNKGKNEKTLIYNVAKIINGDLLKKIEEDSRFDLLKEESFKYLFMEANLINPDAIYELYLGLDSFDSNDLFQKQYVNNFWKLVYDISNNNFHDNLKIYKSNYDVDNNDYISKKPEGRKVFLDLVSKAEAKRNLTK